MKRRTFIKQSAMATAALTAAGYSRVLGANERIRVGFIGVGNRGSQLMHNFMDNEDARSPRFVMSYRPYTKRDRSKVNKRWLSIGKVPRMGETFPNKPEQYTDFRKMLEDKSI
ncbi:MAG: twin-arginine translocation signal domain-containing protein [candidate division KSB1 bacterium]|nr:twin-arginine translocation signal domain-containing protein [candidate division KSB1 bacterium]